MASEGPTHDFLILSSQVLRTLRVAKSDANKVEQLAEEVHRALKDEVDDCLGKHLQSMHDGTQNTEEGLPFVRDSLRGIAPEMHSLEGKTLGDPGTRGLSLFADEMHPSSGNRSNVKEEPAAWCSPDEGHFESKLAQLKLHLNIHLGSLIAARELIRSEDI